MQLPVDIHYRWMTYDAGHEADWLELLSAAEHARWQAFGRAVRRRSFLLGRAAARLLLADTYDLAPASVPLRVAEDGAVVVDGRSCTVSITHTGPHAVAATGRRPLGVDLERIQERDAGLSRFLLHPEEEGLLERLPLDRVRAVILCWTIKEAALKACRRGLRMFPSRLRVAIDTAAQSAVVQMPDDTTWAVRFEEREGLYLAVAFPSGESSLSLEG